MFRSLSTGVGRNLRRFSVLDRRGLHALVLGERSVTEGGVLRGGSLSAITAAKQAVGEGGSVSVLVWGSDTDSVVSVPKGVKKIFRAKDGRLDKPVAETLSPVVEKLYKENGFSHIFAGATTFGKNVMPRIAVQLDSSQISDIIAVESSNQYVRPIYAGNALATVKSKDPVQIVTVRGTAFEKANGEKETDVEKVDVTVSDDQHLASWDSEELSQMGSRPELTAAKVVVSGGRGLKNGSNFSIVEDLADSLGGAVGATRAAVDEGYCPNDMQVGQTGKVVAPELYIAVGLSGAVQHLAGMKDSKTIVAINKDPEAPIFTVADYGLVADLFDAVPKLAAKIKK